MSIMTGEVGTETSTATVKTLNSYADFQQDEKKNHVTYVYLCALM